MNTRAKRLRVSYLAAMILTLLFAAGAVRAQGENNGAGAVVVGDRVAFTLRTGVGSISAAERAGIVNRRIGQILTDPKLAPEALAVVPSDGGPLIALPGLNLLQVTAADARAEETTPEELADRWNRTLRSTLIQVKPLHRGAEGGHHGVSFMPLLLVSALAFLVPLLAARFRRVPVPVVVGEILVGILIGRSGLNLVTYDSWLQFLAEFGFAFLMFLSGLEVDLDLLARSPGDMASGRRSWRQNPVAVASIVVGVTLLLSVAVALLLTRMGLLDRPWMMALILATVSLGLVVPTLKERGLTSTSYGQTLLLTALLADFVTMFLITIVAGWVASGPTLRLFLGLLVVVAFAVALRAGRALQRAPQITSVFEGFTHATAQLPLRGSLALMLAFVALSETLGTEVILGAFLAGVLLAIVGGKGSLELHHKLEALGFGFFIPIFFIMVGARFDLGALVASRQGLLLAPLLIAAAFAVKMVGALPFRAMFSWRETLAGGLLIAPGLSLVIAAAEIGRRLGLFSEPLHAALIAVALVTGVGGPLGFQLLLPRPKPKARRALIAGAGRHGSLLARRLVDQGWEVTLLTEEASPGKEARVPGARLIEGDAADAENLRRAGIEGAEIVVAATSSDATNEAVCREACRVGVGRAIALVHDDERAQRLRAEGVVPVTPLLSTLVVLEGVVTHPAVFELLTDPAAETRMGEATLTNPDLAGRALRDLDWPGDVLVLSIRRDDEAFVPHGATVLRQGDALVLIGSDEHVSEAVRRIG